MATKDRLNLDRQPVPPFVEPVQFTRQFRDDRPEPWLPRHSDRLSVQHDDDVLGKAFGDSRRALSEQAQDAPAAGLAQGGGCRVAP